MCIKNVLFAFLCLLFFSCSNSVLELEEPINQNSLEGYWINGEFTDSIYTYQRTDSLRSDQYCFGFKEDGVFVENKNAGWCATPPVFYDRFTGEWALNDSLVSISVPYWGGMSHYTWRLVEVNEEEMIIVIVNSEYEHAEE